MGRSEASDFETPDFACQAQNGCEFAIDLPESLTGQFCEEMRELHIRNFGIAGLLEIFPEYEKMCPLQADARLEIA